MLFLFKLKFRNVSGKSIADKNKIYKQKKNQKEPIIIGLH